MTPLAAGYANFALSYRPRKFLEELVLFETVSRDHSRRGRLTLCRFPDDLSEGSDLSFLGLWLLRFFRLFSLGVERYRQKIRGARFGDLGEVRPRLRLKLAQSLRMYLGVVGFKHTCNGSPRTGLTGLRGPQKAARISRITCLTVGIVEKVDINALRHASLLMFCQQP